MSLPSISSLYFAYLSTHLQSITNAGWTLMGPSKWETLVWLKMSTVVGISDKKKKRMFDYLTNGWP